MSTQGTTPDIVSSILLAMWRMHPSKPYRALLHLVNPSPPNDYRYLDAFATLCTFVPQCESASAAVELGPECNQLYIAVSPSISPMLRAAMTTWIRLIQQIIAITPSGSVNTTSPIGIFVANVYRVCHAKLLDAVQRDDDAQGLLEEIFNMPDQDLQVLGVDVHNRPALLDSLNILIGMIGNDLAASSAEDIIKFHDAVRTAAKFKENFAEQDFLHLAYRLSEAVDFLVKFATSECNQKTLKLLQVDVTWINAASSRDIITTINTKEFIESTPEEEKLYAKIFAMRKYTPESMVKVEGCPGHFKAAAVMHCESALLQYIVDNKLSIYPYIGASHPVCYACLMLVRAYNLVCGKRIALGRRSYFMDAEIATWMWPDRMGPQVYDKLVACLREDFMPLCRKVHYDRYCVGSIVHDVAILPEDVRRSLEAAVAAASLEG